MISTIRKLNGMWSTEATESREFVIDKCILCLWFAYVHCGINSQFCFVIIIGNNIAKCHVAISQVWTFQLIHKWVIGGRWLFYVGVKWVVYYGVWKNIHTHFPVIYLHIQKLQEFHSDTVLVIEDLKIKVRAEKHQLSKTLIWDERLWFLWWQVACW